MNRLTPAALLASTNGAKASKLIDFPRSGFSSKLGSFEMQARWSTTSTSSTAFPTARGIPNIPHDFLEIRIPPEVLEHLGSVEVQIQPLALDSPRASSWGTKTAPT